MHQLTKTQVSRVVVPSEYRSLGGLVLRRRHELTSLAVGALAARCVGLYTMTRCLVRPLSTLHETKPPLPLPHAFLWYRD